VQLSSLHQFYFQVLYKAVGRDSAVGSATCYRWAGLGIEFWLRRDFLYSSRPVLLPTQPPIQWVMGHYSLGGGCGWGMVLTTHLHVALRLKK